jgi:hypothetical protein
MVLRVSPIDGEARLYPVGQPFTHWGQWQRGIKYCQHAYSSYLGWCATGEGGADLGAGRTGISADGIHWRLRERPRSVQVSPDHLISTYETGEEENDWDNTGELTTHTLLGESGEVHVFWHSSPKPAYLYLGGYGISIPHGESPRQLRRKTQLQVSGGAYHSLMRILDAPPGRLTAEVLEPRRGWSHSHLWGGRGAFPHWQSNSPVPPHVPVVIYVDGAKDRDLIESPISVRRQDCGLQIQSAGRIYTVSIPGLLQ